MPAPSLASWFCEGRLVELELADPAIFGNNHPDTTLSISQRRKQRLTARRPSAPMTIPMFSQYHLNAFRKNASTPSRGK